MHFSTKNWGGMTATKHVCLCFCLFWRLHPWRPIWNHENQVLSFFCVLWWRFHGVDGGELMPEEIHGLANLTELLWLSWATYAHCNARCLLRSSPKVPGRPLPRLGQHRLLLVQRQGQWRTGGNPRQIIHRNGDKTSGYGSIPIDTIFSGLFTSINPSYDLGFTRGTRVLTHPHLESDGKISMDRCRWGTSSVRPVGAPAPGGRMFVGGPRFLW